MDNTRAKKLSVPASISMIMFACVVFDMALHRLFTWAFDLHYFDNGLPQSELVKSGTFPIAAFIGFMIMFGFLALMYSRSRSELDGSPLQTGLRFFAPIALVMFFGVLESWVVFPTPFKNEVITGFADAVPFILLGILLSRFARPKTGEGRGREGRSAPWQSMLWVTLFYVAGRYFSYSVLPIASGYIDRAAGTFVWTLCNGLSMGAFYWLAGSAFFAVAPLRKALRTGLTLGIFWLWVQLFYALMFAVSIPDLVIRAAADSAYLVLGIYSFEKLFRRKSQLTPRQLPERSCQYVPRIPSARVRRQRQRAETP